MSLFPCSACEQRSPGKLSNVTWAWTLADGTRTAWRQRMCQPCFILNCGTMPMPLWNEELRCPSCGERTANDMDPMYCTAFVPGVGRFDFEWPTCGKCAVSMREKAQKNAQHLEDRRESLGAGASGPQTYSGSDVWKALGLEPRK